MKMKLAAMSLLISLSLKAQSSQRSVTLCVQENSNLDSRVLYAAKHIYAQQIFRAIGVELNWKTHCKMTEINYAGQGKAPNLNVIGIEWAYEAPRSVPEGVLACARPFQKSGMRITLFRDRLTSQARNTQAAVLGHVLAHELGHVLLGYDGHSRTGLMKAHWTGQEETLFVSRPLLFEESDAAMIRRNLDGSAPLVLANLH